jgi:PAS domain S-box-containing protein
MPADMDRPTRKSVLVVDDSPEYIELVTSLLKDTYRIRVATSGSRAISLAESSDKPELILLDVSMPEMDGYEVCRRLKANPETATTPIIFLTVHTDVEDETRGLELGAVDYIHKPITPAILRARVKTHLLLKEASDALRTRSEMLAREVQRRTQFTDTIINSLPGILYLYTEKGRFLQWNENFSTVTGYSNAEIVAMTPLDFFDDSEHSLLIFRITEVFEKGQSSVEAKLRTKEGRLIPYYFTGLRIEFDGQACLIGMGIDITERVEAEEARWQAEGERRRIEDQLRQAQKMEAIGNLSGGMAHDFNNMLGVIVGNLEFAREQVIGNDNLDQMIGDSLEAAWRGADLTRRLLAFARRQPLRPARIVVNEHIGDIVRLLRRLLGEDIEVSLDLATDVWPVVADPAQLEAALANLATNARDAMPRGGQLILTTGNCHLDAEYAAVHPDATAGDFVVIEVSDTGTGMSPDIMSRIFEPFFTTKEAGKGTGLGLSMVFGFLRQSGGHVSVDSKPHAGTTFRLYLPRTTTGKEVGDAAPTLSPERGGGETVLVVEDNPGLRRIAARQLRNLEYQVLECDRAADALEMLQRQPVDLLFTDIVMPGGIDGIELARLARERWPALKIVLTSGFPQGRLDGSEEALRGVQLIGKPYSRDELAAVLHNALLW